MKKLLTLVLAAVAVLSLSFTEAGAREYKLGGLQIETTFELEDMVVPIPESMKSMIDEMTMLMCAETSSFSFNYFRYVPAVGTLNLQGAVDGAIANIGMSGISKTQKPVTLNGVPGIEVTGTGQFQGQKVEFQMVIYTKGLEMWQIFDLHLSGDSTQKAAARKTMNSAQFISE